MSETRKIHLEKDSVLFSLKYCFVFEKIALYRTNELYEGTE